MVDEQQPRRLTKKQLVFVEEYLKDFNGTQAAIRAGYSRRSAHNQGQRMVKNDEVKSYIRARLDELQMGADEVLKRLAEQARNNPAEFMLFETDPQTDDPQTEEIRYSGINWAAVQKRGHLVKGLKFDRRGNPMLEFHDAQAALEKIGRYHGLFIDRTDLTSGGKPIHVTIGGKEFTDDE